MSNIVEYIYELREHIGKKLFLLICLISTVYSITKVSSDKLVSYIPLTISLVVFVLIFCFYRESNVEMNSTMWFKTIIRLLKDSTHARIYLRHFVHPDDADEKHRNDIIRIMEQFARMIVEHNNDINIIAYVPPWPKRDKDPKGWLVSKVSTYTNENTVHAENLVNKCLRIVNSQDATNSYSVYILDEMYLLHNFDSKEGKKRYQGIYFERSIIPYFMNLGFNQMVTNFTKKKVFDALEHLPKAKTTSTTGRIKEQKSSKSNSDDIKMELENA